jgi:L-ascorbate metabolism protein UlaG (beta-lactamase superfamily)
MRNFLAQDIKLHQVLKWLTRIVVVLASIALILGLLLWRMWQIRGSIEDTGWELARAASEPGEAVTATWLGVSTVLFDDGETQILIDGFFSRISLLDGLPLRRVTSDIATINYALARYRMNRLAAIIPAHSHFDHAMDVGHIANRTSAVVLGSESTANIVRGANVPVDQYQILGNGELRQFGEFTIKLIASRHVPVASENEEVFSGIIAIPLRQPARLADYKTGVAWSVVLSHPRGTAVVQASAGFVRGRLHEETADVALISVAGLADMGEDYTTEYWSETVTATGAQRVIALHHDDYTAPFGEVRLFPDIADRVVESARWLNRLAASPENPVSIERPPFGVPVVLY